MGADGESPHLSLKVWEPGAPMSENKRWMSQHKQRVHSPCLHIFVLFQLSMDWIMLTHSGDGHLLTSSNANCFWKHPHIWNVMISYLVQATWISLSPLKMTHKINHHTILFLYFFCPYFCLSEMSIFLSFFIASLQFVNRGSVLELNIKIL